MVLVPIYTKVEVICGIRVFGGHSYSGKNKKKTLQNSATGADFARKSPSPPWNQRGGREIPRALALKCQRSEGDSKGAMRDLRAKSAPVAEL